MVLASCREFFDKNIGQYTFVRLWLNRKNMAAVHLLITKIKYEQNYCHCNKKNNLIA
jgi:hypothetical protein